jgi:adenylate cyclase
MSLHQRSTERDMRDALRLLNQAIQLDPEYALPQGMASFCYGRMHHERWHEPDARAKALELARSAVLHGQDDPNALRLAGHMLGYVGQDYKAALAAVDRALALNPNLAAGYGSSGWVRLFVRDDETAVEHFKRAMRLSPLDPDSYLMLSGMGLAMLHQDRHQEAFDWSSRCMREHPMGSTAYRTNIAALVTWDVKRMLDRPHKGI